MKIPLSAPSVESTASRALRPGEKIPIRSSGTPSCHDRNMKEQKAGSKQRLLLKAQKGEVRTERSYARSTQG